MGIVDQYAAYFEDHPVLALLDVYSLVCALVMIPLALVLLVLGVTPGTEPVWLAIIVAGSSVAGIWNVGFPIYDRVVGLE